jgi:DNA-binding LytR/AlgR family response regulator
MIKCIAIDDESLVLDLMVDNIRQVPFLHLENACSNAMEAAEVLQNKHIDLIFLDIQMPRLNGLQFLQTLKNPPMVILVTAYQEYALEGYELNVVDYLLKPVSFERFLKACNKAHELYNLQNKSIGSKDEIPDSFFVNVEYTRVKVTISDIAYVEGLKDYLKIHLSSTPKPIVTRMSLKAMEEKLPHSLFIRTSKSYIIAVNKISKIKRDFLCIGDTEIPVGELYKENVSKVLNRAVD